MEDKCRAKPSASPKQVSYLLGILRGSRSFASNMKMQPSAEVAKSRVSSEPMHSRITAVLKQRCS